VETPKLTPVRNLTMRP